MPISILKNTKSELVIKVVDEPSATITLADGTFETAVPAELSIREVLLTSDGVVKIERNSVVVLSLNNPVEWRNGPVVFEQEKDHDIDIVATATNYTLILMLSKRY